MLQEQYTGYRRKFNKANIGQNVGKTRMKTNTSALRMTEMTQLNCRVASILETYS